MTNTFFKGIKAELKKVVWPTKKQLINNTVMVILLVLALAAIVLTFDMIVKFLDVKFWDLIKNNLG
jgi:preprotein translocase subunit SecE